MSAITMSYQEVKMINVTAPINTLGYGVASYNIIKHLYGIGEQVSYFPIGNPEPPEEQDFLKNMMLQSPSSRAPSVKIWHQNDIHHHVGKGLHVGFPIFELDRFSQQEIWSMSHNDKIFVCSHWAESVVKNAMNIETSVVPLGVDTELFQPYESKRPATIFFNCGKWEIRKGHDVLVECFNSAFSHSDNVELWMMCENPFYNDQQQREWINLYKQSKLGDKIRIIPRQKTHQDVYNIMKQTDCGVFPARAEGWNLELLEMMACGKQVIATNYSAHTEFCNSSNSMLVDINSLELANDGVWFKGNGMWASLDSDAIDQIISHMRSVHDQKQQGFSHQNIDGIQTSREFSWENSAKNFVCGLK